MSEAERIADLLQRGYAGGSWHGPALCELLRGVDAAAAARRPLAGAHSIWELVLHVAAWKRVALRRLAGEPATGLPPEQDFPDPGPATPERWEVAQSTLARVHEELVTRVRGLDAAALASVAPGAEDPHYRLLHGIVQHDLYHAGQIALLKKM